MTPKKAVIFTHIPMTWEQADKFGDAEAVVDQINKYADNFEAYLKCSNVGLIYVYVDLGARLLSRQIEALLGGSDVCFGLRDLHVEQRVRNVLKLTVDEVKQNLSAADQSIAPRFQFVGLPHLSSLLYSLYRIDKKLVQALHGPEGQITYDTPKFIEAVIRLARSGDHPILRFDADVKVNEAGIDHLLRAVSRRRVAGQLYDFFSGGYGRTDEMEDPVNDYAVRVHWVSHEKSPGVYELDPLWKCFLRDLGEIGATQVSTTLPKSTAADKLGMKEGNRDSQQVISGAGLYMSLNAIQQLPPFMNTVGMITWIDDHLKRRLHEAAGHLNSSVLEHLTSAKFQQQRHPGGITAKQVEWASEHYFKRLLCGCVFHALIVQPDGAHGPLAKEVRSILQTTHKIPLPNSSFEIPARQAAERTLSLWKQADYGTERLKQWVSSLTPPEIEEICCTTVKDAKRYLELLQLWPQYVNAIGRLVPAKAWWLFQSVE
jgi:hypothetical protein